mgnify:CR=1 FL=1
MILSIVILALYIVFEMKEIAKPKALPTCGDGTFYDTCSITKPYFCSQGLLLESSTICGCPEDFEKKDEISELLGR